MLPSPTYWSTLKSNRRGPGAWLQAEPLCCPTARRRLLSRALEQLQQPYLQYLIDPKAALTFMQRWMKSRNPFERQHAANSLAFIGTPHCLGLLRQCREPPDAGCAAWMESRYGTLRDRHLKA